MRSTWPAIRSWQLAERIIEADPFTTTQEVVEELSVGHSMVVQYLKQIEKVKKHVKWVPCKLTESKKKIIVLSVFLLYSTTMNHFSIGLWRVMKSWFYMTASDDQLSGWTNKKLQSTFQSQICPEKRSWSLGSAAGLIHYSFLNPSETITSKKYAQQIDEMHWKLKRLQLALISRKGPILLHNNTWLHSIQPVLPKCLEVMMFCCIHHIHLISCQRTTTSSGILTTFVGKTLPQPAGGRKCFPRVCQIPKPRFLCYRNKLTYFSLAKMYWL